MNEDIRGVPVAYANQPIVLPGRRVEPPTTEEYARATQNGGYVVAQPNAGYAVAQPNSGYAVPQQVEHNRYSDPTARQYNHSQRPSGYLVQRSQSLRGLLPAAELPINDMQNTPAKPPEADIVYYGYPDSDPEGNARNQQFAEPTNNGQLTEHDENKAQLLPASKNDPRYVLEDVEPEDSVSHSKIFKLRQYLRVQQKMMFALFGILVMIIVALIIIIAILMMKE